MHRELAFLFTVLICIITLSACGGSGASMPAATVTAQPSEPAVTSSPSASPSPTLIETPSSTPTVTPTAGPSLTPVPTPVFGSARVGFDFLFGNQPEGCELPCWQGLRVGKSDRNDIQNTFEEAFGFSNSRDVFIYNVMPLNIPGMIFVRSIWNIDMGRGENFEFFIGVKEATYVLEYIDFYWSHRKIGMYLNPRRVLQEIGKPSTMLARINRTQEENIGILHVVLLYNDKNLGFLFIYGVEVDTQSSSKVPGTVRYCLGTGGASGQVWITKRNPADFREDIRSFEPWQAIFGVGVDEVVQRTLEGENVCLVAVIQDK